jgi:hypothetical protein
MITLKNDGCLFFASHSAIYCYSRGSISAGNHGRVWQRRDEAIKAYGAYVSLHAQEKYARNRHLQAHACPQ